MDAPDGVDRMYASVAGIKRLYARIEQLSPVVLAEIDGAAMSGGLELALACDLWIAAVEAKSRLPEARLGLIPGAGGTQRLTRPCGSALAARLILGAEILDGTATSALGVMHWAVPRVELAQRAAAIVSPQSRHIENPVSRLRRSVRPALEGLRAVVAEEQS